MYICNIKILYPPKNFIEDDCSGEYRNEVPVDECIADEIEDLWNRGIKTTGCCCGHGHMLGTIVVRKEYIKDMENLGYVHYIYSGSIHRDRRDTFVAKSYGHISNSLEVKITKEV